MLQAMRLLDKLCKGLSLVNESTIDSVRLVPNTA